MITLGLHFECNWDATIDTAEFDTFRLLTLAQGGWTIDLFFPTAEIRDAVRDALLQCPGCVARAEVGTQPIQDAPGAQPAVQAMDATEDWF